MTLVPNQHAFIVRFLHNHIRTPSFYLVKTNGFIALEGIFVVSESSSVSPLVSDLYDADQASQGEVVDFMLTAL